MRKSVSILLVAILVLVALPTAVAYATDGGHCVVGSTNASPVWYFAEGYTGQGFQEYLCLGNPGNAAVNVQISYMFPNGTKSERSVAVPANARSTVNVNEHVGSDKDVSIYINASNNIIAERPIYFEYQGVWSGGHDTVGAIATSNVWYFAEGYTGAGFDEWICVLNPSDIATNLKFSFQTEEAGEIVRAGQSVAAHSRKTFKINELLGANYQTSLKLESDQPIVAERPMYFAYQGRGAHNWQGGHCVMGVTSLATEYYLAEGTTRSGFEEWITLQNPDSVNPISVHAEYQLGPGQGNPIAKDYPIEAGKRRTIFVPDEIGTEKDVSVKLTSDATFLAERPMYFNYQHGAVSGKGGDCVVGAIGAAASWFFAEGYTGSGFDEWLCIQNPNGEPSGVTITYFSQEAGPITKTHQIGGFSRYTIPVNNDAGANLQISCQITALQPIVVERPMYFNHEFFPKVEPTPPVVGPTPTPTPTPSPDSTIVYITNTGSKYHRDGCRYLSQSKIPITLGEAKALGYTPCSVCNPPV